MDILLKAKKFALYIAHFSVFVLKICIKTAQISFICCKTLNKQRFLVFCLVVSKYLCNFAPEIRTKGNNKHNENNKKQEAARYVTGHRNTEQGTVKTRLVTAIQAAGLPFTLPNRAKGRTAKIITRVAEVAANNRFSPQRRKLGYLP